MKIFSEYLIKGGHKINYDAYKLTSGVYYYTLTTGTETKTRRFLIIK